MWLLDLTLPMPSENVALDEALLEEADSCEVPTEVLRLWESPSVAVVIGRSSRAHEEVDLDLCQRRGIAVLRRCSGGAAVVVGPGCLMYSVVLSSVLRPELQAIDTVHQLVLGRIAAALRDIGLDVQQEGTSDLAIERCKVSGNSMRSKRRAVLYHGTLLYGFSLEVLSQCLRTAPRQPAYRHGRDHRAFVTNLPTDAEQLRNTLRAAWPTQGFLPRWPRTRTEELVTSRYSRDDWNLRM